MRGIAKTIEMSCDYLEKPGIYCIEYEHTFDEEIRPIFNGVFSHSKALFVHYLGYEFIDPHKMESNIIKKKLSKNPTPIIDGELDTRIEEILKNNPIKQGGKELKIITKDMGNMKNELQITIDGEPQPLENESYQAILNTVMVANSSLQSRRVICFMIDISRLDTNLIELIYKIFKSIHDELIKMGKFIIIMYSESGNFDDKYFTLKYLWSDSIFNNFALLTKDGAKRLYSYKESISTLIKLADHIKNKNTISIFLGAGASCSSGLPPTSTMLGLALQEFYDGTEDNPEILLQRFRDEFDTKYKPEEITFEVVMSELKQKKGDISDSNAMKTFKTRLGEIKKMSNGYLQLGELSDTLKKRCIIITTNFDNLCERSIKNYKTLIKIKDYQEANEKRFLEKDTSSLIVKLHGDVKETPFNLGILLETNMEFKAEINDWLKSFLVGNHVSNDPFYFIFIGYGFRDKDVIKVLMEAANTDDRIFTPIIVTPDDGENIEDYIKYCKARAKGDNPCQINMSFDKFMEELVNIIK
jgi:hypothetical protein